MKNNNITKACLVKELTLYRDYMFPNSYADNVKRSIFDLAIFIINTEKGDEDE